MPMDLNSAFRVDAAWTSAPWATSPTWSDITDDVYEARWEWAGAQHGRPAEAGTGTVLLRNNDGEYDPDNPGSSLGTSALRRHRLIRFVGSDDSFTSESVLFFGYIDDVAGTATAAGENMARISLIDGAGILAGYPVNDLTDNRTFAGKRIDAILTEIGWPAHLTGTIDDGTVRCATDTIVASALAAINEAAATESGMFWVDRSGLVQFRDRFHQPTTTAWNTVQASLAEATILHEPVTTSLAVFENVERYTASAQSGSTFTYENLTSDFPPVSAERVMRIAENDPDAEATAERLQKASEYTGQRPQSVPLMLWPYPTTTALTHLVDGDFDPGNRVDVTWRPRGHTADFTFDGNVVGYQHTVNFESGWHMTLELAPYATTWQSESDDFYQFGATIGASDTAGF